MASFGIARLYQAGDPVLASAVVEVISTDGERLRVEMDPDRLLRIAQYFGNSSGHIPEGQRYTARSESPRDALMELETRIAGVPPFEGPFDPGWLSDARRAEVERALDELQAQLRDDSPPQLGTELGRGVVVVLVDRDAHRVDVEVVTQYLIVRAVVRADGREAGWVARRGASK